MSIGFSTTTCLPASRAATAPSACTPLGVQIGDGVDVVAAQDRVEVGGGLGTPYCVGQRLRLGRVAVDDGDELGDVGQLGQRLRRGPCR